LFAISIVSAKRGKGRGRAKCFPRRRPAARILGPQEAQEGEKERAPQSSQDDTNLQKNTICQGCGRKGVGGSAMIEVSLRLTCMELWSKGIRKVSPLS